MKIALAAFLTLSSVVTGCGANQRTLWHADHPQWFDASADRRFAVLTKKNERGFSDYNVCFEPAPDVAYNSQAAAAVKAAYSDANGELSGNRARTALELAGRTEAIVFLREWLYRLCEAYLNGAIRYPDLTPIYQSVRDAAVTLAESEAASARSQAIVAIGAMDISRESREAAIKAITQ